MKKLIAIIVILLTNLVIFSACASHDSHAYTWIKTQDGHFKEYYCNCETNESFEPHCDNNNDFICDVCKFALPNEVTPDSSSTGSSTTPDSSSTDSSSNSSVDSSSTSDSSVLDSSLDSSTTLDSSSSPEDSTLPDSSSSPEDSTSPDSSSSPEP